MKPMNSYLEIGPICELNVYPRIGGACALPQNINWPKSASDEPCALLLSADTQWLMNLSLIHIS